MTPAVASAARDSANTADQARPSVRGPTPPQPAFAPRLVVQRSCACGGGCPHCRKNTPAVEPFIQPQVKVGPAGDRFELEADRVADQVMRMQLPPSSLQPAEPGAQRACIGCGQEEEEEELISRKGRAPAPRPSPGLEARALTTGGDPLPAGVRQFFEARFDRDFSHVRVHTGPAAHRLNDDLHAYAFTYSNHIWLGRGQTVDANPLLAHELVHVVQQHHLPRVGATYDSGPATGDDPEHTVRRFIPFWEPGDFQSGEDNHNLVLPAIGAHNSIFTEAPVPNAKTSEGYGFGIGHGFGRKGSADFYKASTTVGAYFVAHKKPEALPTAPGKTVMKDGKSFAHASNAAPQVVNGALTGSAGAPTAVSLGELKPSHGTIEALTGAIQVQHYKDGFEFAHKEANDKDTPGDGASWNPFRVSFFGEDLRVPPQFEHPNFSGQASRKLVLKRYNSKTAVKPHRFAEGHLWVNKDPTNTGVWNYAWVPKNPPKAAQLPAGIRRLGPEVVQHIIDPVMASPVRKKSKPGPPPVRTEVTTDPVPQVRRKDAAVAPEKDTFDHEKWKQSLKELTGKFEQERGTKEFKDVEGELLANQAHEALRRAGLREPEVAGGKETARTIDKIEFWTGKSAAAVGLFRKVFGRAFVTVAQFFVKLRDKFRDFLKKMKTGASVATGFAAGAVKAAFRGLKMIARFVIGRVTDRLMQSLITGVTNKLKSLLGSDVIEELEAKAAQVEEIRKELEKKATDTADALVFKVFGVHLADLEKLKEVYDIVSGILTVVNLVRWGARVIACLSPPAWGCLWILAESALDWAAQKVAETCWFQKKIFPILAKVKYVTTELPTKVADGIIGKLRDFLPASVQDVFAHLDKGAVTPGESDFECDDDLDTTEYKESPLHNQVDELYQKIGPERAYALSELARKMKVAKDRELTPEELRRLGEEIAKVDAEKMLKYAEQYPTAPEGVPADISKLVEQIENQQLPATPAPATPPPATTGTQGPEGPVAEAGKGEKKEEGGGKEAGEKGEGGGGMAVVDAADRFAADDTAGDDIPGAGVQVANPSWGHTKGDEVSVHTIVYFKGSAVVLLRNVPCVVEKRKWWPDAATTEEEAAFMVVHYKVKRTVLVNEVPGGRIVKNRTIPGQLPTRLGKQALELHRERQAAEAGAK